MIPDQVYHPHNGVTVGVSGAVLVVVTVTIVAVVVVRRIAHSRASPDGVDVDGQSVEDPESTVEEVDTAGGSGTQVTVSELKTNTFKESSYGTGEADDSDDANSSEDP